MMLTIKFNHRNTEILPKCIVKSDIDTSLRTRKIFKMFAAYINVLKKMPDIFVN